MVRSGSPVPTSDWSIRKMEDARRRLLFNLKEDPEERNDISGNNTDIIGNLKERVKRHFYHLYPRQAPDDTEAGDPKHWGGYYGPGWCDALSIVDIVD